MAIGGHSMVTLGLIDFSGLVVPIYDFALQEHVQTSLILYQRVSSHPK